MFLSFLSHWALPNLVSQTYGDVRHFNEVQLRHLLIDFHEAFVEEETLLEEETYFQTACVI